VNTLRVRVCSVLLVFHIITPLLWAQEVVPFAPGSEPVEIIADQLEYLKDEDRFVAQGSVKIIQGDLEFTSDHAELDNKSRWLTAHGEVDLYDGESHLRGDRLKFNLDTKEGVLHQGTLFVEKEHFYLESEKIEKLTDDRYRFQEGSVTTCDFKVGQCPVWQIRARRSRMKLDGYLVARDVVFKIKGVPVFYLPYFVMPVKTTRQTGFLIPRIGYNTDEGFKINQDFYWAITPSQDATFSLDYRSSRGIGGGLEYRYQLDRESGGILMARIFDDRTEDTQQLEGEMQHRQVFSQDLRAHLSVHLVNDVDQFRELSEVTGDRVKNSLESNFIVFRRWDKQYLYLLARHTRDLMPDNNLTLEREAVQKLPEIGYRLSAYSLGGLPFYLELEATGTSFWPEEEAKDLELIRAQRFDILPRIVGRFNLKGWVITPRIGWRETWYSRGLDDDSLVRRSLGLFDVGTHLKLSKGFVNSPDGKLTYLRHSVEPALFYEYSPTVDQDDLPKFDAVDEMPDKNLLTFSLTNRLVGYLRDEDKTGAMRWEVVMLKVTQSYDIHEKRKENDQEHARPFSNVRGEVTVRPHVATELEVDSFYNVYERQIVRINTDLKTQLSPYVLLSVGQRLTREGTTLPIGDVLNPLSQSNETFWYTENDSPMIRFFTGFVRVDFPFGLSLANRTYYDAEVEEFAEVDYELRYDGQCWGMIVSYIDLPEENQFSFMITLKAASPTQSKSFMGLLN
jgi:LPS-assembly protein